MPTSEDIVPVLLEMWKDKPLQYKSGMLENMYSWGAVVGGKHLILPGSGTGQIGKNEIIFPLLFIMKYFSLATS